MTLQIGVVADGVLPIAALPDSLLSLRDLAGAALRTSGEFTGKSALDLAPAQRKIRITLRQGPDCVQVVWEHADRDGFEWIPILNRRVHPSQLIDLPHEEVTRPVGESDGEEKDPAFDLGTTISRHSGMIVSSI
jgi:hypothetical protein